MRLSILNIKNYTVQCGIRFMFLPEPIRQFVSWNDCRYAQQIQHSCRCIFYHWYWIWKTIHNLVIIFKYTSDNLASVPTHNKCSMVLNVHMHSRKARLCKRIVFCKPDFLFTRSLSIKHSKSGKGIWVRIPTNYLNTLIDLSSSYFDIINSCYW